MTADELAAALAKAFPGATVVGSYGSTTKAKRRAVEPDVVGELVSAVTEMLGWFRANEPERLTGVGWVRLIAALDAASVG